MKKITSMITLATLILLVACSGKTEKTASSAAAVSVQTATVGSEQNAAVVSVSGKIEAANSANISTRMMGYVTQLAVKMGQKVQQGQLLVSINNTDIQAKKAQTDAGILQAKAAYNNAKKDYDRFKNLFEQQSATQKELDDMTARLSMAQATLEGAQQMRNEVIAQLAYANVRAPFSGVITGTFVKEGDMANPGMPLVSMEGGAQWQAVAMVPESQISGIKSGMKASILVKSIGKTLAGTVTEVSASAQNTGGQYLVKVSLEHPDPKVLSGMFVRVDLATGTQTPTQNNTNGISVLSQALVHSGQLSGVYVVSPEHKALLRWLRLGKTTGNQTEVLSGLASGETYVVSASEKLYNGVLVQP